MNSIFQSDMNEGESISLNSNNIIVVSEDTPRWSQTSLRAVKNVLTGVIESNSSEMDDAEMSLDAKNIMIESEDSSEWSQNFISVTENQASRDNKNSEWQEGGQPRKTANKRVYATSRGPEDSSEMSNSVQDPRDLENKENTSEEFLNPDLLRCRTCLNVVDNEESVPLYTLEPSGETLKDLLIYLLPQMVSTLCDEDIVCKQCDTSIKFCVEFIDNCLKVENELLNEYEEDNHEQKDEEEVDEKFEPQQQTHVKLDHDYMVAPDLKSEPDTVMETDDTKTGDNLLSNDDPTLASTDEYLFECFRCGVTFESEKSFDNHARTEHGILKEANNEDSASQEERIYYKCNSCEVLFATKKAYNLHVQSSHPELGDQCSKQGTYTCKQCGNKFFYLGDLFEHKRNVHGFICNICPERFNTKEELATHIDSHPDLYFCEVCDKSFKTKRAMSSHMKIHDSQNMCDECGRNFATQEELTQHLELDDHPDRKGGKKFMCDLCDSGFADKKRLTRHKQVFHDFIREYLCTICDKHFSSKTSLDSHYRLKHAEVKPYQCDRCGERFARLDYLRRHNNCSDSNECKKFMKGPRRKFRYTKSDGEPIRCKLCGKVFKDVYLLKLHLTTHTNLRRFRCSVCNLTFTTNKNRERHEKIHDDPLSKYRCTVCWKRTQSQEELAGHMMSHDKKYQCHVCYESFARVYLLNYHVSEVHADDEDVEKEKQIVFTEGLKEYLVDYSSKLEL